MIMLLQALTSLFRIWQILLFVWVILSWIPQVPRNHPAVVLISQVIEPTLAPFRRLMPMGGMDVSPIIAFFVYSAALGLLRELISRTLY